MHKAQTATEYLVIVGIVLVISVLTVGIVSDVTTSGASSSESAANTILRAQEIGITEFAVGTDYTSLLVRNNKPSLVTITDIVINNIPCSIQVSSDPEDFSESIRLKSGGSKKVYCFGISSNEGGEPIDYPIRIEYTDETLGASFAIEDTNLRLVGLSTAFTCGDTVNFEQTGYGATKLGSGTESDPYRICNCAQLQAMSENPTSYFALYADIDCQGYQRNTSAGLNDFYPIPNFQGSLNGRYHTIENMKISERPVCGMGMFQRVISSSSSLKNFKMEDVVININENTDYTAGVAAVVGGDGRSAMDFRNIVTTGNFDFTTARVGNVGSFFGSPNDKSACDNNVPFTATPHMRNVYSTININEPDRLYSGFGGFVGQSSGTQTYTNGYFAGRLDFDDYFSVRTVGDGSNTCNHVFWDSDLITGTSSTGCGTVEWPHRDASGIATENFFDALSQTGYGTTWINNDFAQWPTNVWYFPEDGYPQIKGLG